MMSRLTIDRLGARGEGVAQGPEGLIYVPYALAGETIAAEVDGSRGTLVEVLAPSPSRIAPFCRYFSRCGGCAVQTLAADSYARWKRDLVASALRRAGLAITVADLADAHGAGRRRATFHARYVQGRPTTGFMKARAHDIVEIDSAHCSPLRWTGPCRPRGRLRGPWPPLARRSMFLSPRRRPVSMSISKAMGRSMTRNGKASCGSRWNTTSPAFRLMARS
jgi:tRNA/tmRNA/rRNA uracil-C5-methylase (TrmA/RlmC/RlmD family)